MSETTSFNPSDEYINALLCKVAYEGVSVGDSFLDLDTSEFSETERNFLQSNFEVVDSSSDFLSGFKACWIRNKETNEVPHSNKNSSLSEMAFLIILDIVILNAINNSDNYYISPFGQVK